MLGVEDDGCVRWDPGDANEEDEAVWRQMSASIVNCAASSDHSSNNSRRSVCTGCSPASTEPPAPSAQRLGHEASQSAR